MNPDEQWMDRALGLAAQGVALASPNPLVGAVLVRDGQVVGEAFHTYEGRRHAEVLALEVANAQAGDAARGATLYINLEPCCHQGRTGPCTEAIIAAGIQRVVAAMADPNPQVSGRGFERLRQGGVEVETGLCREQAERLNESFACYIRTGLPLVTLKTAMTLDGKIAAPDDNSGLSRAKPRGWVTSEEARAHVQRQRHAHDAILTGIGTILADDPLLTDRCGLPRRRPLLRVVLDSRLRIPATARLLEGVAPENKNDLLIFCSSSADPNTRRELERRGVQVCALSSAAASAAETEPAGRWRYERPDLRKVLEELGRREITSVLLEAGAELNGAALDAGVVDKVFLYYAPKILGGRDSLPMAAGRGVRSMRDALQVHRIRHYDFGPDFAPDFAIEGYLRDVYADH
ncbi:MAG: riboflavin biosynthesis protein RibD [Acidobacteria bacterium RIFCSPLOWO2_02_FULL_61_28]|nr:MAG: riboflavin biosynthesis protein RibD [Acidobacteria bacterium RIFCSPLOWO2_02_FULL_61_28]